MPVPTDLTVAPVAGSAAELAGLRAELRCILQHPAIAPARRQMAGPFIDQCADVARLQKWLALVVAECGRWEEQTLAAEGAASPERWPWPTKRRG